MKKVESSIEGAVRLFLLRELSRNNKFATPGALGMLEDEIVRFAKFRITRFVNFSGKRFKLDVDDVVLSENFRVA